MFEAFYDRADGFVDIFPWEKSELGWVYDVVGGKGSGKARG